MPATIGPIIFDLIGTELGAEEVELLQHPLIGGVIFFTRNFESPEQMKALCQSIRAARKKPILLTVDQEGGRVQRFRTGFTALPSMGEIGKLYEKSPEQAIQFATTCGWILAAELLEVGVDLSFAPILDIDHGVSTVIGNRAFHNQSAIVIQLATALVCGMQEAGMAAVGKHFPGHGSVPVDSHLALPVDTRPFEEVAMEDIVPFSAMIASGIQGVMAAHILFPEVDERPVGFSPYWLQKVLREHLKFSGVIFSDCLTMEGASIAGGFPERVQAALEAGCEIALVCNNRENVIKTLDGLPQQRYLLDERKVSTLRGKTTHLPEGFKQSALWKEKHRLFNLFYPEGATVNS